LSRCYADDDCSPETPYLFLLPLFSSRGGGRISPLHQTPRMMDDDERGAVGGMIGRGNRSPRRKCCPSITFYGNASNVCVRHCKCATVHFQGTFCCSVLSCNLRFVGSDFVTEPFAECGMQIYPHTLCPTVNTVDQPCPTRRPRYTFLAPSVSTLSEPIININSNFKTQNILECLSTVKYFHIIIIIISSSSSRSSTY
jgi:hypothetical protein